jgi:hypothetical protein
MLHPSFVGDVNSYHVIHLKPYEFCERGYTFYDVVVTSCNHTYHPFCLGEMLKNENKHLVCKDLFHLEWWTNYEFCEQDEELQVHATTMHSRMN